MGWFEDFAPTLIGGAGGFLVGGPAGAAIGAQIGAGVGNANVQRDINDSNIGFAREQMNFQKEMSNTAHQREITDLQKAGLNPTLSAGGNGSSTPTGASPALTAPKIELPDMMAYGISLKQLDQTDRKIANDTRLADAAIAKNLNERDLIRMKTILAKKGQPRAELEGEGANLIRNVFRFMKDSVRKTQQPGSMPTGRAKDGTFTPIDNPMYNNPMELP